MTRTDFAVGSARATYAMDRMGQIPAGVLNGTLLAEYRPGRHLASRKLEAFERPRPVPAAAIASEETGTSVLSLGASLTPIQAVEAVGGLSKVEASAGRGYKVEPHFRANARRAGVTRAPLRARS